MRNGPLRHRISLQRLTEGSPNQDAGGVPDDSWVTLFSAWAEILPLRGRELIAAQQVNSEVTGTIRLRQNAGNTVTAKDRVLFGTRTFDILAAVNPRELGVEWLLYVKEGNSG
jgi:SPP1 family predicted phage head-tail adaptor